jgi:Ger(x)C family germination protein
MRKYTASHARNAVRYYIILAATLLFLFFSNDFGLADIQKTAIVMAVGIDREEDEFLVTAQIAIPSKQNGQGQAQAVQIESRGETVSLAFCQINAKTGWYPKLVFCNLIVLGEEAVKQNAFDALDFFLRDEYMSDSCFLATCEGSAKDILNTQTPIDQISSIAAQKVLSEHAQRLGTVATSSLKDFSKGYFSAGKSGYLPILKAESQQETPETNGEESGTQGTAQGTFSQNIFGDQNPAMPVLASGAADGNTGTSGGEVKVFSASETALFYDGVKVGTLSGDETFAFCMAKDSLRLAAYSVKYNGEQYRLTIKKNKRKIHFSIDDNAVSNLRITIRATAGLRDAAFSQTVEEISSSGVPAPLFMSAEEKLKEQIIGVFEKSRACKCDLFEVSERLQKFENKYAAAFQEDILERLRLTVDVQFESLR